jgi:hypothetical protein
MSSRPIAPSSTGSQRTHHEGVHDAKNRDVSSDPNRKRDHENTGEDRAPREAFQAVNKIPINRFHRESRATMVKNWFLPFVSMLGRLRQSLHQWISAAHDPKQTWHSSELDEVSCPLVRYGRLPFGFCPSTRTLVPRLLRTPPLGDSPCIIAGPSPPSGRPEDFHLHVTEHAQHTTKPLARRTLLQPSALNSTTTETSCLNKTSASQRSDSRLCARQLIYFLVTILTNPDSPDPYL